MREPGNVMDLLPTFLSLAGANYPTNGNVKPEGQDITAMFKGTSGNTNRLFCWEHEGNRAIRDGRWKLVALAANPTWQLYDITADRIEGHDLAAAHPEMVAKLSQEYDDWAKRCGVIPHSQLRAQAQAARATAPRATGDHQ